VNILLNFLKARDRSEALNASPSPPRTPLEGRNPTALEWPGARWWREREGQLPHHAITARGRGEARRAGVCLFLVACGCLGLVEIIFRKPLPELHPIPATTPEVAYVAGATLSVLALAGIARVRGARLALAIYWSFAVVLTFIAALKEPSNPLSWVPMSKAALFAIAALVAAGAIRGRRLQISLGAVLIFYGVIHLVFHDLIAELIPSWFPKGAIWPYFTGPLMLVAGAALVADRAASEMALAVAALFSSWILIIHLGRLAAHSGSSFEWTFALSALALVGVALMAVSPDPPGEPPD